LFTFTNIKDQFETKKKLKTNPVQTLIYYNNRKMD